jgi:hypothetical protein
MLSSQDSILCMCEVLLKKSIKYKLLNGNWKYLSSVLLMFVNINWNKQPVVKVVAIFQSSLPFVKIGWQY